MKAIRRKPARIKKGLKVVMWEFLLMIVDCDHAGTKKRPRSFLLFFLTLIAICNMVLCSCKEDGEPIDKPDAFTQVYQAREKYILRAIYQVIKDRDLGKPTINEGTHEITSDYVIQGEWRIRTVAHIREISRNEGEVTLSIITEKKTPTGWEMRRLLGKEQYDRVFYTIDTQIYREMYKLD
jgi:hypothetical protein